MSGVWARARRFCALRLLAAAVITLACLFPAIAHADPQTIGEVGNVTGVGDAWQSVTFTNTYTDPIVVVQQQVINGANIARARVRNVTGTGFEVQTKEFDVADGGHAGEDIAYFVVERGSWVLPNGHRVEAGTVAPTCCNVDSGITFATQFASAPQVIASSDTSNASTIYYRIKDITATGFNARQEDVASTTGNVETLNWIAFETGGDTTYGHGASFTGITGTYTYGVTFAAAPSVFMTTGTYLDAGQHTARITAAPTTSSVNYRLQRGNGPADNHPAAETVSGVAIPDGNVTGYAATTVWNTNDSGDGSLRAAIEHANANPGDDDITFNISGAGPHTITLATELPIISDAGISIDGETQPGASCGTTTDANGVLTDRSLQIQIDANGVDRPVDFSAGGTSIRGIAIYNSNITGINLGGTFSDFTATCNHVGTNAAGLTDLSAQQDGFRINGWSNVTIGDGTPSGRNIAVGSVNDGIDVNAGSDTVAVLDNYLGIGLDGTTVVANGNEGLRFDDATNGTVTGNLMSGNGRHGLEFSGGSNFTATGNKIGVDPSGTVDTGNTQVGIRVGNSASNVTIGDGTAAGRNIISGNGSEGIYAVNASSITILGNHIGTNAAGSGALANDLSGIFINGSSTVSVGDGTANGRNVISGNAGRAVQVQGTVSDITINGNYIGTDTTGNNAIASGDGTLANGDAISFDAGVTTTTATITNNVIGGYQAAYIEFFAGSGSNITIQGNNLGVGANDTSNISASALEALLNIGGTGSLTNLTIGGPNAGQGNRIANGAAAGIAIDKAGSTGTIDGNTITGNTGDGITIANGTFAMLSNTISGNSGLGIDLGTSGITANDSPDNDTGANDLLNFPVLNALAPAANGTDLDYDFNLDTLDNSPNGYRIEFFKNLTPDGSGNGEGEIFLGAIDIPHTGGDLNFTGTLTPSQTVSIGDSISATTTRKTATGFDITSEFSANQTVQDPLVVTNTNDSGAGSLRAAIAYANANTAADNISFALTGGGPYTITPLTELPALTDAGISIDGSTQAGASCGQLTTGTQHTLQIMLDGNGGSFNGLVIGADDIAVRGLSIVNFGHHGIDTSGGQADLLIECNYVGIETDGSTAGPLAQQSEDSAVDINSATSPIIRNNVLASTPGNGDDILRIDDGSANALITGNIIGLDASGTLDRGANDTGLIIDNSSGTIVGGTTAALRNIISGNNADGIRVRNGAVGATILGNYIGTDINGNDTGIGNTQDGIEITDNPTTSIRIGDGTAAGANLVRGNLARGIRATNNSRTAILANTIYGNGGIGVDLNGVSGVTANDVDDTDGGPNDQLNFPVLNAIAANGTTTVNYDFNLDVPDNDPDGYRIEFYTNATPDASGHGEGETFLGFVDIAHTGGDLNFDGTFTATQAVSAGDSITATATRKTATGFDITSEFAENVTAGTAALTIVNAADLALVDDFETITWTTTVTNTGTVAITDPVVAATLTQGGGGLTYLTGPVYASGDTDTDSIIDVGETWLYTSTFAVGGTQLNNGQDLLAVATIDTQQLTTVTAATVTTSITLNFPVSAAPRCTGTDLLTNGGFEAPAQPLLPRAWTFVANGSVDDWSGGSGSVEIQTSGYAAASQLNFSHSGAQHAEINSNGTQNLAASAAINPRAEVSVFWAHKGRNGSQTASLLLADDDGGTTDYGTFTTDDTAWSELAATHVANPNASNLTLTFDAVTAGNSGNLLDSVEVCQTYIALTRQAGTKTDVDASSTDTAGDTLTLNFTISNPAGNHANLSTVEIVDTVLGTVSVTPTGGDDGDGLLEPGETWTFSTDYTLTQADVDATQVQTTAYAQGATGTNTIRSDDVQQNETINKQPAVSVTKTADQTANVAAGTTVTYTYTVTNTGNQTLSGLTLTDTHKGVAGALVPTFQSFTTNNGDGTNPSTNSGNTITALYPGDVAQFTATYTVTQEDVDALQ